MSVSHIAYYTRSGRILRVYHRATDTSYSPDHIAGDKHVAVITGSFDKCEPMKQYKVDVRRKTLVEAAVGEQGVQFGFGRTGRLP